jgi:3-isopropylmalate/(R)-2-methylmalate dehydratase large subunit
MAKTLYDKLWENHVVHQEADGTALSISIVILCTK